MTKDEQIGFLFEALETIAYGHVHSCGEDAEDMRDEAREAIAIWRNAVQPKNPADNISQLLHNVQIGSCPTCGMAIPSCICR